VGEGNGPGAQAQTLILGRAAEVQVVEVKIERRIEQHVVRAQNRAARGEKQAVQQLAGRGRGAEVIDVAKGRRPVGDAAAEVTRIVQRLGIDDAPAGLPGQAARVAGHADDIECPARLDDAIDQEEVVDPDIVVHEDRVIGIVVTIDVDAGVENVGKAATVVEGDVRLDARFALQAPQRLPQRAGFPELLLGQAGGADDFDDGGHDGCRP